MTINYPNGRPFYPSTNDQSMKQSKKKESSNHSKIKQVKNKQTGLTNPQAQLSDLGKMNKKQGNLNYGNRGMSLEDDLNLTNEQYRISNKAIIHKKPTPIQVVKVDYPKREAAKITEAYYRRSSTTDYNGVYRGFYIDFEAKETKNKTSFPLNNFHEHQIEHMKQSTKHGGICFTIVLFSQLNQIFLLRSDFLFSWWNQQFKPNGRKSIPHSEIKKHNYLIEYGFNPRIPYLEAVDYLIDEINTKKKPK